MVRLHYILLSHRQELHPHLRLLIHSPSPQDLVNALGEIWARDGLQIKLPQYLGNKYPDLPPSNLFARTYSRALAERLESCPVVVSEFGIEERIVIVISYPPLWAELQRFVEIPWAAR